MRHKFEPEQPKIRRLPRRVRGAAASGCKHDRTEDGKGPSPDLDVRTRAARFNFLEINLDTPSIVEGNWPRMPTRRCGRPLKFSRPGRLLTLSLPDDVLCWLKTLHPDPAWAIVALYERVAKLPARSRAERWPTLDLAQFSPHRSLIVVDARSFRGLPGIAAVPVAAGRAFLAFDEGRGIADLELAIQDRIHDRTTPREERREREWLRRQVREWRRSRRLRFARRSIILVERAARDHGRR